MASASSQNGAVELGSTDDSAIFPTSPTSTQSPTSPSSPSSRSSRRDRASRRPRLETTTSPSSPLSPASTLSPTSAATASTTESFANMDTVISPGTGSETSSNDDDIQDEHCPANCENCLSRRVEIFNRIARYKMLHPRFRIAVQKVAHRLNRDYEDSFAQTIPHPDVEFRERGLRLSGDHRDSIVLSPAFCNQLDGYKRRIREDDVWAPLRTLWMRPMVEDNVVIEEIIVLGARGFFVAAMEEDDGDWGVQRWFWEVASVAVLAEMIMEHSGAGKPPAVRFHGMEQGYYDMSVVEAIGRREGQGSKWEARWTSAPPCPDRKSFVWAVSMPLLEAFDEIYCKGRWIRETSDPGVLFGEQAELMFEAHYAYRARSDDSDSDEESDLESDGESDGEHDEANGGEDVEYGNKETTETGDKEDDPEDDGKSAGESAGESAGQSDEEWDDGSVDVEATMIEFLRRRKVEGSQGVELPDLIPDPNGGPNPSHLFSDTYLYWRPGTGDTTSPDDEYIHSVEDILAVAKKVRQADEDDEVADLADLRIAYLRRPLSDEEMTNIRHKVQGLNAARDLDQGRHKYGRLSKKFRNKFETIKLEIRNSDEWAAQRTLLFNALDNPACANLDKIIILGMPSFYTSHEHSVEHMNTWFYYHAWAAVVVDLVAEKRDVPVQWLVEHDDGPGYFDISEDMFKTLGATLLNDNQVQEYIGESTVVINLKGGSDLQSAAESLLTSPPAIYIGQRLEYLLHTDPEVAAFPSTSFNAKAAALAFLQSHESDNLPPFERDYLIRTGMKEAAPQDDKPEDNVTEDDAPEDGAREEGPSKYTDPEEDWNLNEHDEAIYWPSRKHDVDVDALIEKFSRALFHRYDDDESDGDGEDEDENNGQDDGTHEVEVEAEEGDEVGAEEQEATNSEAGSEAQAGRQEYGNSEEGGEVELGKQDADDNESASKNVKNKQE